ncbi:MAG: LamG domain-containing protein [Deltaproteobacteria bacterium]|nr:LamG domain-containing protein [Deltaproteobacteria bacterium]
MCRTALLVLVLALAACGRLGFATEDFSGDATIVDTGPSDAVDLTSDLSAWFKLDETSGAAVVNSAGAGQSGAIQFPSQATWQPGRVAGSLRLDNFQTAAPTFVQYPSTDGTCAGLFIVSGGFTVSAWVWFERFQVWDNGSLSDIAVMNGTNGGSEGGWGLGATDACGATTIGLAVTPSSNGSRRAVRCGTTPLATNEWLHLTGVYDPSVPALDVYLNGSRDTGALAAGVGSEPVPSMVFVPNHCINLGTGSNQYKLLAGSLDEVRVYLRAFTADEVAALYAASSP